MADMDPSPSLDRGSPPAIKDLLHQLPSELLLKIMKASPDLASLCNLTKTSPSLLLIFDSNAREIVETVVDSTCPTQIQFLMRAVVLIRTKSFECQTYLEATRFRLESCQSFGPAASPTLLRKFVGLAHKIYVLAHECIDRCMRRCMSMKPLLPRTNPFQYDLPRGEDLPQKRQLQDQKYWPKSSTPPSWIEEQRATLSFWRVQFFFELKVGRLKGRLNWCSHDLHMLQIEPIHNFCAYGLDRQQVLTAFEFIEELSTPDGIQQQFDPPHATQAAINSVWSSSTSQFQLPSPPKGAGFGWHCQSVPFPSDLWQSVDKETIGWSFLMKMTSDPMVGPLQNMQVDPYRKFGFVLWDEKTLVDFGLWSRKVLSNASYYYDSWFSILTDSEITDALIKLEDDW